MRRRYPLVETRIELDRETLLDEYVARGKPVVVRTAGARDAWSFEALGRAFGSRRVAAEETKPVFVGEREQRRLALAEIIERVRANDRSLRWKGLDLLEVVHGMTEHLAAAPPASEALLPASTTRTSRALWLAPAGTMSSFHHDGNADNFNWQVSGKKLFLLAPPDVFADVYAYGSAESPINPFSPELARFPKFADVPACEALLEPGDVLLIPKYWWHCVYTVEPSVNLNTWFDCPEALSAWRALAGVPLFHRACSTIAAEMKSRDLHRLAATLRKVWSALYRELKPRPLPEPRGLLLDP